MLIKKLFGKMQNAAEQAGGEPEKLKKGMSLRSKLLLMLLSAAMTATLTVAYLAYQHGERELHKGSNELLTSIRIGKQQEIEWYFDNLRNMLRVLGDTPTVSQALSEFTATFNELGKSPDGKTVQEVSPQRKQQLEEYYRRHYFKHLDEISEGKANIEIFWPRSPAGRIVQSHYIADNPHAVGDKGNLKSSGNNTKYDKVHRKYHSVFSNMVLRFKFHDVFLIDAETGAIVYSTRKEPDFGTGLKSGPYSHTALGSLFNDLSKNHRRGRVLIKDYSFYTPSLNEPALFIGTPVFGDGGKFKGIIAAQLTTQVLNDFMTNKKKWRESGLGDSGEMYLVGDDYLMRSVSRFLVEDKKNYLQAMSAAQIDAEIIKKVKHFGTSTLLQQVKTEGVRRAFLGETSTKTIDDYRGVKVVSSYAPLDIPDLRWAILAEIDLAEARAPQNEFTRNVLLTSALLLLAMTLGSLFIASKFLKPISVLIDGADRIRDGEKNVKIEKLANDEFGELSDTFNVMTSEVDKREEKIEQQSAAYDSLLNRIYPANIVERLKKGENKIADSLHQVSVVYLIIHGYSKETEAMDSLEALDLLNELVDSLDTTCDTFGIEKVKTIGEHYLAVCGLSVPRLDHARRALDFSHAASRELSIFNARYDMNLALRIGIHSGPLKAGIVGNHNFDFDVWGNSLNIARRIVFEAELNTVRITTHTYHMLNTSDDFGTELIVDTKVLGDVSTFQQDLDITLDENRLDSRARKKKKAKSDTRSSGKKQSEPGKPDDNAEPENSEKPSGDSSKAAE